MFRSPRRRTQQCCSTQAATAMEQQVGAKFEFLLNQGGDSKVPIPKQALALARSLILNPSTSESTLNSVLETLSLSLQPDRDPFSLRHILFLLSHLAARRPNLSHPIFHTIRSFSLQPDRISPRTLVAALFALRSIAKSDESLVSELSEFGEGIFLSHCFGQNVSVRHWLLLNAERFHIRPKLLLPVFLAFTKDPYPLVRRVALDGLVGLSKSVVVDDTDDDSVALVESCYCGAVELLNDRDDSVRSSALLAVTWWGQLVVASYHNNRKRDMSDMLFVQLCSMARDMNAKIRMEAFDALGEIGTVSQDILLQSLSKKILPVTKGKTYHMRCSTKSFDVPASGAAGAFVHGLEDEFREVRRSACHALHTLSKFSANFAGEALNLLMDVLNDDSMVVRLQSLEAMQCMASSGHLKVQETHLHMFINTLFDNDSSVRCAARKVLRAMKLSDMMMFKRSVDGLHQNLEMYPQDEGDIFYVLFHIGRNYANFVADIIREVSDEIEPSCDGKLELDSSRVAVLLVLAISVPLSIDQRPWHIPPKFFRYALTLLERISKALSDVMDQDTLLAYLSHCIKSTEPCAAEFGIGKKKPLVAKIDRSNDACPEILDTVEMKQLNGRAIGDSKVEALAEMAHAKFIIEKVRYILQLNTAGCTSGVLQTLRIWKEELATFRTCSSCGALAFAIQYLKVVKRLSNILFQRFPAIASCNGTRQYDILLEKLETALLELRYKFIGLSKLEELHVVELILLTSVLRMSSVEAYSGGGGGDTLEKLNSRILQYEYLLKDVSQKASRFVTQLKGSLSEINHTSHGPFWNPVLFKKLANIFSLEHFVFDGELIKHLKAELDVDDNSFENPSCFVPGFPVGIPLEITLYNISRDNRLWLQLGIDGSSTEMVFLDLDRFGGNDQIRKFRLVAPFYRTPRASYLRIRICIGMECLAEDASSVKSKGGPRRELVYLCKEKEVFFSSSA